MEICRVNSVFSPHTRKHRLEKAQRSNTFHAVKMNYSQSAFTCSKSTMETPDQCVKSVQS